MGYNLELPKNYVYTFLGAGAEKSFGPEPNSLESVLVILLFVVKVLFIVREPRDDQLITWRARGHNAWNLG